MKNCRHERNHMDKPKEDGQLMKAEPVEEQAMQLADPLTFNPSLAVKQAQEAAKAVMEVAKPLVINNDKYFRFEDWQLIGSFYNVTAGIEWTKPLTKNGELHGYAAKSIIRRNGIEVGGAEASCMKDEKRWGTAPTFQIKSMAQTRAMAKGLRSVLGHVAILAGVEATPAEEMDAGMTNKQIQNAGPTAPTQQTNAPGPAPICQVHKQPMRFWPKSISNRTGKPVSARWSCGLKNPDGSYCTTAPIWIDEDEEFDKAFDKAQEAPVQEELPTIDVNADIIDPVAQVDPDSYEAKYPGSVVTYGPEGQVYVDGTRVDDIPF